MTKRSQRAVEEIVKASSPAALAGMRRSGWPDSWTSTLAFANGLSIRYPTVPGLRYRTHGGTTVASLPALGGWTNGVGAEQEFVATPGVTGGASRYFLRLEVARQ